MLRVKLTLTTIKLNLYISTYSSQTATNTNDFCCANPKAGLTPALVTPK